MNRAIFLDRDGVINRKAPEGEYIASWHELVLLPGVLGAVRRLRDGGFLIFIATNQRGVARQRINAEVLDSIHHDLLQLFSLAGAPITQAYVCPHEGGCECRKPAPGMMLRAAQEHAIELKASWVVGDSTTDVEAGKRAGCRTARIGGGVAEQVTSVLPDLCASNLSEAADLILRTEQMLSGEKLRTGATSGSG